jgi:hypothetical protein
VYLNGTQACRFDKSERKNTLIINDRWDYNSLLWGNYQKLIPLEKEFAGRVVMNIN